MKRSSLTILACSALLAAGCANKSHQVHYESSAMTAPTYGSTSTTYNDQIYNQRTVDNSYRSSTELSNPESSTTYNQTTIETTPADTTLIQQVQLAIRNDIVLATVAPTIQVSAQGGTVTLSGNVQNEDQKRAVERAAKGTAGVVTVNNQLQVSSDGNQSSQIQPGTSQTGGSQSRLYQNSTRQSQGPISGGVGASSSGSVGASTDLKGAGTNDTEQTGTFGKDSSSGATSDKYGSSRGSRLYSTKDDLATNSLNKAQGAGGESSLGSTNSASASTSPSSSGSDNSLSSGSLTSQKNSDASVYGAASDTNTVNSSSSQGETKNLSPTSSGQERRLYSTNQNDQVTSDAFSSNSVTNGSSDSLSLSVQGATESDQKLADQVRQELSSNSAISGGMSRLRISLDNGKATIRGTVKSDREKQDIEKSVQKVTGVTSVQNELRISSNAGQSGTDESR